MSSRTSAGKAKAGIVHSVSGCTWGMQVKLWNPFRTRAIPQCLRGVITTRCYTNPRLPYLILQHLSSGDCLEDRRNIITIVLLCIMYCSCTVAVIHVSKSHIPVDLDISLFVMCFCMSLCLCQLLDAGGFLLSGCLWESTFAIMCWKFVSTIPYKPLVGISTNLQLWWRLVQFGERWRDYILCSKGQRSR